MSLMRSGLMESGMTMTALYPSTAASAAMPMPVLPLVGSMIRPPGAREPSAAAARIMASAARSLALPVGFVALELGRRRPDPGGEAAEAHERGGADEARLYRCKMRAIIKFLRK